MNIEEMQAQRDADYEKYKAEGRIWGTVPREKIVQIQIPRTSKEVIDRYYALEDMSTAVSDILDTYGIHGAVPNTCLKASQGRLTPGGNSCHGPQHPVPQDGDAGTARQR